MIFRSVKNQFNSIEHNNKKYKEYVVIMCGLIMGQLLSTNNSTKRNFKF